MNKYNITIKFKSASSGSELGFLDKIINNFIKKIFWNTSDFSYNFKIAKLRKHNKL